MRDGSVIALFYTSASETELYERALAAAEDGGFEGSDASTSGDGNGLGDRPDVDLTTDGMSLELRFNLDEDRGPQDPPVRIRRLTHEVYPPYLPDGEGYADRMGDTFELLCRLADGLEVEYAAVANTVGRINAVVPDDRPIGEAIDGIPQIGVFSDDVLADLGGLDAAYEDPWYTARTTGGRTVVFESDDPWSFGDWEPPTDAEYLEEATLRTGGDKEDDEAEPRLHRDPFASLEPGSYGTDIGVHPDDIAEVFRNESLRLERVYVADDGSLRRIEDDGFVRWIVEEPSTEPARLLQATLDDVPPNANRDRLLASALFHWAIPQTFVRLDDPDDENVVTRVANLDADTSKYDLLLRLGDTTFHEGFDDDDLETMEGALNNLQSLAADDSIENVEQVIEDRLL